MSFAQLKQKWDYFFTWTILYKFDFHCFEFDPWQVEILEVECIMADFFEAGITNMVREGETCLILPYFIIHVKHIFSLSLIICNCRRDPEGLLWWKTKGDGLCSGQEQLILSAIFDGMNTFSQHPMIPFTIYQYLIKIPFSLQ